MIENLSVGVIGKSNPIDLWPRLSVWGFAHLNPRHKLPLGNEPIFFDGHDANFLMWKLPLYRVLE
jgi:hypothetical protein